MVRRFRKISVSSWSGLLWGMALLGLFLLPSAYRAGAETGHAHSFVELWVDAADGAVHHHDDRMVHLPPDLATSWFDPALGTETPAPAGFDAERPDVAEQQESAPAASGVHLLLTATAATLLVGAGQAPAIARERALAGLSPRILLPPPRWTPAAA